MPETETAVAPVAPVVREIVVAAPVETCFTTFVDGFGTWWPPEHHIGDDRTMAEFVIERRTGGRCYDVDTAGGECHWGTVLHIEPPTRLLLAWHIQADWTVDLEPARQSEVEVTFSAVDPSHTRVRVEHRLLERHGRDIEGLRAGIEGPGGWPVLLGRFADAVEGRPLRPVRGTDAGAAADADADAAER